tara:strand:+ start:542 stop:802 length:261 start_codon:yes stop_codon:yes gene_type:complete
MHNTRTYAVINLTDVGLIDFSQVGETSPSTIRKSLDDTQFVIKWQEGYIPTFITDSSVVPVGTYDHHAILELMATSAWSSPIEEIV